jgi:hypothetical protein
MNRGKRILVCVAGWLALQISARAVTADLPVNSYQPIVVKNVFRLGALPDLETAKPKSPPPTITLQGITCLGRKQVLFKVVMALKPGDPPQAMTLVLNEGDRHGEIEVLEINERTATVKFRNHGQVQWIWLGVSPGRVGAE